MLNRIFVFGILTLLIPVSVTFVGQASGEKTGITIEISLYNGDGVPWANHEISIINERTGEVITVETDENGEVTINGEDFTNGLLAGDEVVLEENLFDGYISWVISEEIKSYSVTGYFDPQALLGVSTGNEIRVGDYTIALSGTNSISYTAKVNRYTADSGCYTNKRLNYLYAVTASCHINDQRTQRTSGSSATLWEIGISVDSSSTLTYKKIYTALPYSDGVDHSYTTKATSSGSHTVKGYQKVDDGVSNGQTFTVKTSLGNYGFNRDVYVTVM